ncbi:IniB N-terminal domain-containing protein [Pseudonocardia acaciae]|uniref:IniB N-terminal domain-containing protein n=1 Tax=Pseudonocardia acaciae TaxID=551276 RepID=UPI00048B310A|nr:IniB N-terminal domain-containing protein [Pseudonocardia acaciae]
MSSTSLLDWILSLLRDPDARADFQHDPDGYAAHHGFEGLSGADIHDALMLIADSGSASYDHKFHDNGVHYPPPHHYPSGESAPHYLNNYITNNYKIIDDHSTNIDNSVHQNVDTHGGDFDQVIDNDPVVASGDHSVAAGEDIEDSDLTTGDHNVVGDDNEVVTGDHNTTAFGSGDATDVSFDHANVSDGGALSVGGNAHGHAESNDTTTSVHNSGSGDTSVNAAGDHGYADQTADQSHHDNSGFANYEDHSQTDSHDDINSHNTTHAADSHDVDVHHV